MIPDLLNTPQDLIAMISLVLLSIIPALCGGYVVFHFFSSLKHPKPGKTRIRKPKSRIAVVIPAHNESAVIAEAVRSAFQSDYPYFDVVVIADNCDDDTAEIARQEGAIVYERVNPTLRSKSAALKWLFYQQGFLSGRYDALCIMDADSVAERDMLGKLESRMREGYSIVQARGRTLNTKASSVAYATGLIETMQNIFWHASIQRKGLSDVYTGKGVLISCAHLRRMGWHIHTLVEDMEFSLQTFLAGEQVYFCNDAVFYSEQASSFTLFWRQQRRWTSGQIACCNLYIRDLYEDFTKNSRKGALPQIINCLMPYSMGIGFINIFLSPLLTAAATHLYVASALTSLLFMVAQFVVLSAFGCLLTRLNGDSIRKNWKGILTLPVMTTFLGFINLVSLLKPKRKWEAMQHATQTREDFAA